MNTKEAVDKAVVARRDMQYQVLLRWGIGKLSGTQCIEEIIEMEKLIPINFKETTKSGANNGK